MSGIDMRIPSFVPRKEVEDALGFAVSEIERIYGTKNGATALYWHFVGVVGQHAKLTARDKADD